MDVIQQFLDATSEMASPEAFRLWTAVSVVSAVMSRQVWTNIEGDMPLYGNTYIGLVSAPGIGKSRPMRLAKALLNRFSDTVEFAGDEATREEVIQHMGEIFSEDEQEMAHSFYVLISEFSTFMPKPDLAWMQALAEVWDSPDTYTRRTKHMGKDFVYRPYVNMLAGIQPAWFAEGFPKNSYELGLPARIYFIYADHKPQRRLFQPGKTATNVEALVQSLAKVTRIRGHIPWAPEASGEFVEWHDKGMPPFIEDPLLRGYATRRDVHAAKLALIVAVSRGHKLIEPADLRDAWSIMFAAEQRMPDALAEAGGNTYRARENQVIAHVAELFAMTKRPVHERVVRNRLGKLLPTQHINAVMEELVLQGRLISINPAAELGNRLFKPGKNA